MCGNEHAFHILFIEIVAPLKRKGLEISQISFRFPHNSCRQEVVTYRTRKDGPIPVAGGEAVSAGLRCPVGIMCLSQRSGGNAVSAVTALETQAQHVRFQWILAVEQALR
jgi:hypothetical protein